MSRLLAAPEARLAVIAVAVFAALSLLAPDRFLSAQNITSMAFQFPEFAILALAMTITMLTGGIDLSVVGRRQPLGDRRGADPDPPRPGE